MKPKISECSKGFLFFSESFLVQYSQRQNLLIYCFRFWAVVLGLPEDGPGSPGQGNHSVFSALGGSPSRLWVFYAKRRAEAGHLRKRRKSRRNLSRASAWEMQWMSQRKLWTRWEKPQWKPRHWVENKCTKGVSSLGFPEKRNKERERLKLHWSQSNLELPW